jgi:hypothetical protein
MLVLMQLACLVQPGVDEHVFACTADPDCTPGRVCLGGRCRDEEHLSSAGGNTDAGQCQVSAERCEGGSDEDCDGMIDCADPDCESQLCSTAGHQCRGGDCSCTDKTGALETIEASCGDSIDNDCDRLVDCADVSCQSATCGAHGRSCSLGVCACSGNGALPEGVETTCYDGRDNDCDGLVDCQDPSCATLSCGSNDRTCSLGACACSGGGGAAQAAESLCSDGRDNDCDGLADCRDMQCGGKTCGAYGKQCAGLTCSCSGNGGPAQAAESICDDGKDNDCDGLIDCADPECNDSACASTALCASFQCRGTELLRNTGFESATEGWTYTWMGAGRTSAAPRTGSYHAFLGDLFGSSGVIRQSITIPSDHPNPVLTYWLYVQTDDTLSGVTARMSVELRNASTDAWLATVASYTNQNKSTAYTQKTFSLEAYRGSTVQLTFSVTSNLGSRTRFNLDDVSVR